MGGDSDRIVLRALHPVVAFAFDFDETLAPSTTDVLLEHLGVDPEAFRVERVQPRIEDGWEKILAEAQALRELSESAHGPISRDTFVEVGERIELYPGVEEMFDRVTEAVHGIDDGVDVEFHLITAGTVHVPAATPIAARFTTILGGHWAFDEEGRIVALKNTLGHYEKVRHLKAIAKGLPSVEADRSSDVDSHVPEDEWHVPFEQIVFVGDGDSDLPAFELMRRTNGSAIAVRQADAVDDWESRGDMREGREVATLVKSEFSEGSPLLAALCAAGQRAAAWVRTLRTAPR